MATDWDDRNDAQGSAVDVGGSGVNLTEGLIFCTSFIDGGMDHPARRWMLWFDYYRSMFPNYELRAFNDGPVPGGYDRRRYPVSELTPHLGRRMEARGWGFPGWRRSFREALRYAEAKGYTRVIHIESDLYIRRRFQRKYAAAFRQTGYYTGYSRKFAVIESALQVINDPALIRQLIEYFESDSHLVDEGLASEAQLASIRYPNDDLFVGERLEGDISSILKDRRIEYYAQCDYDRYQRCIEAPAWPFDVDIVAQRGWRAILRRVRRVRRGVGMFAVKRIEGLVTLMLLPALITGNCLSAVSGASLAIAHRRRPGVGVGLRGLWAGFRRWGQFVLEGLGPLRRVAPEDILVEKRSAVWRQALLMEVFDAANLFDATSATRRGAGPILVVQLNHLGNALLSLPALAALHQNAQGRSIEMLAAPWNEEVFIRGAQGICVRSYNPGLTVLRRGCLTGCLSLFGEVRQFFHMRRRDYAMCISMDYSPLLHMLIRHAIPAREWIGPESPATPYYEFRTVRDMKTDGLINEGQRLMRLVRECGALGKAQTVQFQVSQDEAAWADGRLAAASRCKVVIFGTGAGVPSKEWPIERFAEVGDRLSAEADVYVVLVGTSREKTRTARMVSLMKHSPLDLAGSTTLGQMAAVMRRAALFVGNDSGPMHLAVLLGLKTVGLFGPTRPEVWAPQGVGHVALQSTTVCPLCDGTDWRRPCDADGACMKSITVQDVFAAAVRLLHDKKNLTGSCLT